MTRKLAFSDPVAVNLSSEPRSGSWISKKIARNSERTV